MMGEIVETMRAFAATGGMTMAALLAMGVVLWFALAYRAMVLRAGWSGSLDQLVAHLPERSGVLTEAALLARRRLDRLALDPTCRPADAEITQLIHRSLLPTKRALQDGARVIRTIVIAAPLLGLLGTVVGMVETFDAFAALSRAQQSEGIARGISRALVTTEVGLFLAIAGLLLGRTLDATAQRRHDACAELEAALLRWWHANAGQVTP